MFKKNEDWSCNFRGQSSFQIKDEIDFNIAKTLNKIKINCGFLVWLSDH